MFSQGFPPVFQVFSVFPVFLFVSFCVSFVTHSSRPCSCLQRVLLQRLLQRCSGVLFRCCRDFRALWRPCAACDSRPQGFMGAMRCVGLTHASDCMGLAHTSSLNCREKSGWQWLSGVRHCEPEDTHPFDNLAHQFVPLPVSRSKLVPTNLRHCIPAN